METNGFSQFQTNQANLQSIIKNMAAPPPLDISKIEGTLGSHKITFGGEENFSFKGLFGTEKDVKVPTMIGKQVSKADENHEAIGGEVEKTNEIFHEMIDVIESSELSSLEDFMIGIFEDAESLIEKWQAEDTTKAILDQDFKTEFIFDEPNALQEKWQSEDLIGSIQKHDMATDFVFDEPAKVSEKPLNKENEKTINYDNEAKYLKFERLLVDLNKSDKNKLKMNSEGDIQLKKRSFLSRFIGFFSRGKSVKTQNALKSILNTIKEDLKNGNLQYRNVEGKVYDLTRLAEGFENTKYGKGVIFHNDDIRNSLNEIKNTSKELKIKKFEGKINIDNELEIYEPSEKVENLVTEMLQTERTYRERIGSPLKQQWDLRNKGSGNFFDLLLDRGLMSTKQHTQLSNTYGNAHKQVQKFLKSLDDGRHRIESETLKLYLNAVQPENISDYIDSMRQINLIYEDVVIPLTQSLRGNPILEDYRNLTGKNLADDLITPMQRASRHGLFLGEIAKDASLNSGETNTVLAAISNSNGYIQSFMS